MVGSSGSLSHKVPQFTWVGTSRLVVSARPNHHPGYAPCPDSTGTCIRPAPGCEICRLRDEPVGGSPHLGGGDSTGVSFRPSWPSLGPSVFAPQAQRVRLLLGGRLCTSPGRGYPAVTGDPGGNVHCVVIPQAQLAIGVPAPGPEGAVGFEPQAVKGAGGYAHPVIGPITRAGVSWSSITRPRPLGTRAPSPERTVGPEPQTVDCRRLRPPSWCQFPTRWGTVTLSVWPRPVRHRR